MDFDFRASIGMVDLPVKSLAQCLHLIAHLVFPLHKIDIFHVSPNFFVLHYAHTGWLNRVSFLSYFFNFSSSILKYYRSDFYPVHCLQPIHHFVTFLIVRENKFHSLDL